MKHPQSDYAVDKLRIIFDQLHGLKDPDFVSWQPPYDLYITEGEVVITIEIAGVKAKDFTIHAARNYLIIDGMRESAELLIKECCRFHNSEIPYGRFNRKIDFPVPVQPKQYKYRMDNGILSLRFPIEKEKIIPIENG